MEEQGMSVMGSGGLMGGFSSDGSMIVDGGELQQLQLKAEIAAHPLYEQLLAAHVSCLHAATPTDQLPLIDAQLSHAHPVLRCYAHNAAHPLSPHERQDLDNFMTQFLVVLCSFRQQLLEFSLHAAEAITACREFEQNFLSITGTALGEGTGATMSEDEDDHEQFGADHDLLGFGPLLPTESERTLMERVRQELKTELKQGFKSKIEDVREEILRKRRAGKLPGDTTTTLKDWWQKHANWPYPTEDDKAKLVEETGLQLKQINNWFINQRKRNWDSSTHRATSLKSKRKR